MTDIKAADVVGTAYCTDCYRHRSYRVFTLQRGKGRRKCDDCMRRIKARQRNFSLPPAGSSTTLPSPKFRVIPR